MLIDYVFFQRQIKYSTVWKLLNPVFHHMGNTANLYIDDDIDCLYSISSLFPVNRSKMGSIKL